MTRLLTAIILIFSCTISNAATKTAVFDGSTLEHRWALKDLNPDLPTDWTDYEFLILEMRHSTPQRFELRLYDAAGMRRVRLHPMPAAWIRAAVPLRYFKAPDRQGFDLASLGNKPRSTVWVNLMGPQGSLTNVEAVGVAMTEPLGQPSLEIRSVRVSKDDPGDAILEDKPLIDEFGQWIYADWPGKAKTLDALKRAWAEEEKTLKTASSEYCKYGGYLNTKAKATGYFRVEQIDGRWWFVDPDGHLFLSTGVDVIQASSGTRTARREAAYAALPPKELLGRGGASFYTWNLERRFGVKWKERWNDMALRRLGAWGFNTIANWSDPELWAAQKRAYVIHMRGWGMETGPMGMPDVYSPDWEKLVDRSAAEQCAARKDDPYLLGYFVANEPTWPGREPLVVSAILDGPQTAVQREAKKFLAEGDTPERRKEFIEKAFGRFVSVTAAAIRRHDPNHLNLGMRFGSHAPDAFIRASRVFDVYSLNTYVYEVNQDDIERATRLSGRPVVIGEFHFGTLDRGLAAGLRQTANQEERGVAYRHYVENAMSHSALIGTHWFQWVDQPPTGRMDGENYNIGLVDVTDRPHREMVEAAQATHRRLQAVHSGKQAPVTRKARVN